MDNLKVGDVVEVVGYSRGWDGTHLKVTEIHDTGLYSGSGSVSGKMLDGPYAKFGSALFDAKYLRKVKTEKVPEEPATGNPVKATVDVVLNRGAAPYYTYEAEFETEAEFEGYQSKPFTDMVVGDNSDSYYRSRFLVLKYKDGTAQFDPNDVQLVDVRRVSS